LFSGKLTKGTTKKVSLLIFY